MKRAYTSPKIRRLYTVSQLAEMADVSPKTMRRLIRKYDLRCLEVGSKWLVPLSELAEKMPDLCFSDRYAKLFERLAAAEAKCD